MAKQDKKASSIERARRRQRRFNKLVLITTVVIIILVTAYTLTKPPQFTPLPDYLNTCIPLGGPWVYSEVFQVFIQINGVNQTVPPNIGIAGTCVHPMYTLSRSGAVHVDTVEDRTFTLRDFFLLWGASYGSNWSTFDENHLFTYTADNTHHVMMWVNNVPNTQFENYKLPRDANTQNNPYSIGIEYG